MLLTTERLILRPWSEDDAADLYELACSPNVGPPAGWMPHQNCEESLEIIRKVLNGIECYAVCRKADRRAIGAIELKLRGHTNLTAREDECELGYWLGEPFWGQGLIPEAAEELLRRAFEDLHMTTVWCGYYDGNEKSKRVQEKVGFLYHHTCTQVPVPMLDEVRTGHVNCMRKERWQAIRRMKNAVL